MRTEDLEAALASLRASIIESRTVSVEWLLSSRLVCVRKVEIWLKPLVQVFLQRLQEGIPVCNFPDVLDLVGFIRVGLPEPV